MPFLNLDAAPAASLGEIFNHINRAVAPPGTPNRNIHVQPPRRMKTRQPLVDELIDVINHGLGQKLVGEEFLNRLF